MKDYAMENMSVINRNNLKSDFMKKEDYIKAHKGTVISCHDVFIFYRGGILLVKRKNFPEKNNLWAIGGRIKRGMDTEESLKQKTLEETGLEIEKIKFLGIGRTLFKTDPFGHGKGTDTLNLVYFAVGKGKLKLNGLHEEPIIVNSKNYKSFRFNPYIKEFLEKSFRIIERK